MQSKAFSMEDLFAFLNAGVSAFHSTAAAAAIPADFRLARAACVTALADNDDSKLTQDEEKEILDIIAENSELNIICVVDNDKLRDDYYKKAVEEKLEELSTHTGQFYKGTLRSGQVLESESSIIILGDVNPGARVISKGNVVVLGCLKGLVFAGANGNQDSFVVALEMAPMQIRIGDVIARSSDSVQLKPSKTVDPKIAFVDDNNIYIEKLDKNVLSDIRL